MAEPLATMATEQPWTPDFRHFAGSAPASRPLRSIALHNFDPNQHTGTMANIRQ